MASIRSTFTLGCLLLACGALATNLTDIIQADQSLKNELLNKNSPSPSPTPPAGPFIPAPVTVQVSATQAPSPTLPPQTNPPSTVATPTTPAPPTTALPTSCTGLAANARCAPSQAGINTATNAIVGGRCVNNNCVGTEITYCTAASKQICTLGAAAGKTETYCDPLVASERGTATGQLEALESGGEGATCNTSSDCPLGMWCDAYYNGATYAGECVGQC